MSDTRRHVQPGWGPGNPEFDRRLGHLVFSTKHHAQDRRSYSLRGWRFHKGVRNIRPNLLVKVDQLRAREAFET